ncbi:hypothetical protein ACFPL7_22270 [Dongia soli]|uniref:Glycine-rich domain-containing protein n=1 Tax=Dongia soli TaxID=600628 RepID=A0ABU5E7R5_9PROT|nr:hypothetical protein [Dongia soli]MDY0882317.1 hypothetical protein [Dongia soli]
MQRIDIPTAVAVKPAYPAGGVPGFWANCNPNTGDGGTFFDANWANRVQEEIAGVIEGAGIDLDAADDKQMYQAILEIIANATAGLQFGGRFLRVVSFNAAGTFTYNRAADCKSGYVIVKGGAGPGGQPIPKSSGGAAGGGGGEGGRAEKFFAAMPATATVIVGDGGTPGAATDGGLFTGSQGGTSSFSGVSATGGSTGQNGYTTSGTAGGAGGAGGQGSGGDLNFKGQDGGSGTGSPTAGNGSTGGVGGGLGGGRGGSGSPQQSAPGSNGGGGGGGSTNAIGNSTAASPGGAGFVIIFEMT